MNTSPSELELLQHKHTHELIVLEREIRKEAAIEYAKMVQGQYLQARQFAKDYGQMAIRSVFLLNGGALVSLIAFMGSISKGGEIGHVSFQPSDFINGFIAFVIGLIFAMLTMILAFINFGYHSQISADNGSLANAIIRLDEKWPHDGTDEKAARIDWTYNISIGVGLLSMIAFMVGCIFTGHAFGK